MSQQTSRDAVASPSTTRSQSANDYIKAQPHSNHDEINEGTSLLSHQSSDSFRNEHKLPRNTVKQPRVTMVLALQLLTTFAWFHLLAPKLRLLELTICRTYYETQDPSVIIRTSQWPNYDIEESKCKERDIQQQLSNLRALGVFFDALCTLLLSIPYGVLADWYGRRKVYGACILGLILSNAWFMLICTYPEKFPVSAVLASSAFLTIGGGSSVLFAIAVTMGADVTSKQDRSTVLYWILSSYFIGYVLGTGLSRFSMQLLPLLPYLLSGSMFVLALILTISMSPTRDAPPHKYASGGQAGYCASNHGHKAGFSLRQRTERIATAFTEAVLYVKAHFNLFLAILALPLIQTRGPLSELLLPYVSKRYGWSLGQAGILDAMNGVVGLFLCLVALPYLLKVLSTKGFSSVRADCLVAQLSTVSLCIGALIVGFAPHIAILIIGWLVFSTGFGVRMSVLAVATSMVEHEQVARLTTVILTAETVADLTFSPLLWKLWSAALQIEGFGLGLPWYAVAGTMFLASLLLLALGKKLRDRDENEDRDGDLEQNEESREDFGEGPA